MNFTTGASKEEGILTMDAELTLNNINNIKNEFGKAMKKARHLTVDVQAATLVDLTFLQLICAAHRTVLSEGKTLKFAGGLPAVFTKTIMENGFKRKTGCALNPNETCLWVMK